ncbi:uncharacterized protein LOC133475711 isoform X2 [Phyllopteryx taeniolatus]|uniref:uncharacterized protein LOC133475711 isoform X2 n=1 Tax=Phyllopteryx taeniolatus TaxID=161469 RepID=UPI002AD47936|nr:uncharacterized protein LOC133475711 isoform X2 [Phyllopteryx taeniolatus]
MVVSIFICIFFFFFFFEVLLGVKRLGVTFLHTSRTQKNGFLHFRRDNELCVCVRAKGVFILTQVMDVLCPRGLQVCPVRDFDRKVEIRAEKHEQLRRRTNVTSCRIPARECDAALLKQTLKSRRQVEFMRRRSLPPPPANHRRRRSSWFSSVAVCYSSAFSSPWSASEPLGPRQSDEPVLMKMMVQDELVKAENEVDTVNNDGWLNAHASHKRMREASVQTEPGLVTIEESDILQLQDYMQEGLWREEAIMKKVAALQELFVQLQNALKTIWNARCTEDALRNKIKVLETQLQAGLQMFPKEASGKLVLQMKKQRVTVEEKTQRDIQEKNEDLSKTVALKEALLTAKADVLRLQSLYEELMLTSQKLRQELDASGERAREQESHIELSSIKEATLTEELVSLRREKNKLQFNLSLQEEYYQFVKDRTQNFSDDSVERRDVSVQSTPEEEAASPKGDCDVEEKLLHTQEVLRSKEKECEALRTELQSLEQEVQAGQARLAQCREELGKVGRHRSEPMWRVSLRSMYRFLLLLFLLLLLLLLLAVAGVAVLQPWHLLFGEKLEDFYFYIRRRIENYFMQMTSAQHSGCFRPI